VYLNKTCTNTSLKMNRDRSFRLSSTTHQRRPLQLNPGTLHGSMILFYWGFILFNLNSWHLLVKFPDFHVAASLKSERFPACIPAVPIGRTPIPQITSSIVSVVPDALQVYSSNNGMSIGARVPSPLVPMSEASDYLEPLSKSTFVHRNNRSLGQYRTFHVPTKILAKAAAPAHL